MPLYEIYVGPQVHTVETKEPLRLEAITSPVLEFGPLQIRTASIDAVRELGGALGESWTPSARR